MVRDEPHDVLVDGAAAFGIPTSARCSSAFDPKTLKLTEYLIRKFKDKAPTVFSIEFDHTGKIWFDTMYRVRSNFSQTGEISIIPCLGI
jgi:hypothetical protein